MEGKQEIPRDHYSFLSILDNIGTSSDQLTLAPFTTSPQNEAAVRITPSTPRYLASDVNGPKHLSEVSILSNVSGSGMSLYTEACPVLFVHNHTPRSPNCKRRLSQDRNRPLKTSAPLSPREPFQPEVFADVSQLQPSKRNRAIRPTAEASSSTSKHTPMQPRQSRPASMYNTATVQKTSTHNRYGSQDAAPGCSHPVRHPPNFKDQRYEITSCDKQQQNDTPPHTRRFKLMRSFKDLNARSQKKRKTDDEHKVQIQEGGSTSLLSLQEALRGSARHVSFFNDATPNKLASKERTKPLRYQPNQVKPDSVETEPKASDSKFGEGKAQGQPSTAHTKHVSNIPLTEPFVDNSSEQNQQRLQASLLKVPAKSSDNSHAGDESNFSQISSDRRISVRNSHIVGQMLDFAAGSTTNKNGKSGAPITITMVPRRIAIPPPTAPPERPLPRLPDTNRGCNISSRSTIGRIHTIVNDSPTTSEKPNKVELTISAPTIDPSRSKALAASKGLSIDFIKAVSSSDPSSQVQPKDSLLAADNVGQPWADFSLSPLRLRFSRTGRNAKVHELKKRHMSMQLYDSDLRLAGLGAEEDTREFLRRKSAPSTAGISPSIPTKFPKSKPLTHLKRLSSDRKKPLPLASRSHNRRDSATLPQMWCGKDHNPNRTSLRSEQCRRSTSEKTLSKQSLARSNIMVLVESDPQSLHGFRAGTISPTSALMQKCRPSLTKSNTKSHKKMQKPAGTATTKLPAEEKDVHHECAQLPKESSQSQGQDQGNMRDEISRLSYELDRMTRVYGAMVHARQGLPYPDTKSYAELLEDDRKASRIAQMQGRRCSPKQATEDVLQRRRSAAPSPNNVDPRPSTAPAVPEPSSDVAPSSPSRPRTAGDSDTSTSASTSFQSTFSRSWETRTRKYSDASLTDPNHYDCLSYTTPLGSSQTTIKPARRTSSLISKTTMSSSTTARSTSSKTNTKRKARRSILSVYSPYPKCSSTKPVLEVEKPIDATPILVEPTASTLALASVPALPHTARPTRGQNEVEHFLVDTDQMDHAIDAFVSASSVASPINNGKGRRTNKHGSTIVDLERASADIGKAERRFGVVVCYPTKKGSRHQTSASH